MRTARLLGLALFLTLLALTLLASPGRALAPPEKVLQDRMIAAGLERVLPDAAAGLMVRGYLPGEGESTVLLFAGCGAGQGRSSYAALQAVADLSRTPRSHTLEVIVCGGSDAADGSARRAGKRWLELHPAAEARDRVLAALHLEIDDRGGTEGVGLLLAGSGPQERRLPPAWLAHFVLQGGRAGGGRLAIGDRYWPLMGQLLGRFAQARVTTGAEPFLAAGVPAMTIAGGAHDDPRWPSVIAGVVRRLDSLAGRPRDDDVYLVLGGRVGSRRDLYWVGLVVFLALIVRGLPGAWRGGTSGQRRRRGRRYLPGFVFRMLFLVVLLMAPTATLVLLVPAAVLTLVPLRRPVVVWLGRSLAALPAVLLGAYWAVALAVGRLAPWPAQPLRLGLVLGGVALAAYLVGRRRGNEATIQTSTTGC